MFRQAAYSLHHNLTPMGNYLRRMKSKIGPAAATTATAHKIAVIFYTMVKNQVEYDETIWATRDLKRQQRIESRLKRQATTNWATNSFLWRKSLPPNPLIKETRRS